MRPKITKGPWRNAGAIGHALWITSADGQIACVYGPSTTPEGKANAQAIAATPDLIEALIVAREYLVYDTDVPKEDQLLARILARIETSLRKAGATP